MYFYRNKTIYKVKHFIMQTKIQFSSLYNQEEEIKDLVHIVHAFLEIIYLLMILYADHFM